MFVGTKCVGKSEIPPPPIKNDLFHTMFITFWTIQNENKRLMGHNTHLINKHFCANWSYSITLIKREKTSSPFWELNGPYFLKAESHSPKEALCQVWLLLDEWLWRRFTNFVKEFSQFQNYLPLKKGVVLHLNKFESHSPKDAFAKFGWNWPSASGEERKMWKVNRQTTAIRKAHLNF